MIVSVMKISFVGMQYVQIVVPKVSPCVQVQRQQPFYFVAVCSESFFVVDYSIILIVNKVGKLNAETTKMSNEPCVAKRQYKMPFDQRIPSFFCYCCG